MLRLHSALVLRPMLQPNRLWVCVRAWCVWVQGARKLAYADFLRALERLAQAKGVPTGADCLPCRILLSLAQCWRSTQGDLLALC